VKLAIDCCKWFIVLQKGLGFMVAQIRCPPIIMVKKDLSVDGNKRGERILHPYTYCCFFLIRKVILLLSEVREATTLVYVG
jgi:hypothetical protein